MKIYYVLLVTILCVNPLGLIAQNRSVIGTIVNNITGQAIPGATILWVESNNTVGTSSNAFGNFILKNIAPGRQSFEIRSVGYEPKLIKNIMVESGRQTQLHIKLKEKFEQLDELVVKGESHSDNNMAFVSKRGFTVEQTERFAGSLGDPARMVSNYAGVMSANDTRNDIIIRGNSPYGVLWRLEGIEIPNPNHFATSGTTGGSVSMINNNLLSNSNFLTGAFPAEYGNALAGVFDLNMRSGNRNEHEFVGQVGFSGFEFGAEGPLWRAKNGNNPTFLINYRYSTLDMMNKIGFDFGTGTAIPKYQDLSLIIDMPTQHCGHFKIIGLHGKSNIKLGYGILTGDNTDDDNVYTQEDQIIDNGSTMTVGGLSHTKFFTDKMGFKSNLSIQDVDMTTDVDSFSIANKVRNPLYRSKQHEIKLSAATRFIYKPNSRNNIQVGAYFDHYIVSYLDSTYYSKYNKMEVLTNADGAMNLIRAFAMWENRITKRLTTNIGLYSQYFNQSKELTFEPRLSVQYQISKKGTLSFGYGRHSQTQPRPLYFREVYIDKENKTVRTNEDMKFSKANHFVLSYNTKLWQHLNLKIETYQQFLSDIPISRVNKQFSMLNYGDSFGQDVSDCLVNKGTGHNQGLEITLEQPIDKGFYYLLTASLFDSKYKGYDRVERNTAFNGNFATNILAGYEFELNKNMMLTTDAKITWAGGKRYVPVDEKESDKLTYVKYDWSNAYKNRLADYFKTDLRIGVKLNGKRITQEWALDLQNLSNHKNMYSHDYSVDKGRYINVYQIGFTPMLLYRVRF